MTWEVKTAADFMRRKLVTLRPETKVVDGVARLLKDNISGAPVVDPSGMYLGVFSEKCCMNAMTETVELAAELRMHVPRVREFMMTNLIALAPEDNVFDAIDHILAKRISGAPVIDPEGRFLGIFSEKTAMRVLVAAAYDQFPGTNIAAYMNTDLRRIISEDDTLIDVAHRFQQTPYRRLPVLRDNKLAGQVSRRDVLRSEHQVAHAVASLAARSAGNERLRNLNCNAHVDRFMDCEARTITAEEDILSIAQVFLSTPYRRLAVLDNGKLVGQVSRRDLLSATAELLRPKMHRPKAETLYLSPLSDSAPPSIG